MAGQKLKTHKGASKRFKRTGTGKVVRRKSGMRHILTSKARDRKRRLKRSIAVAPTARAAVNRLMPYNA
ncbi:MAG: 50S ribosomal protein L35 [Nitrospiraceae bacterium]